MSPMKKGYHMKHDSPKSGKKSKVIFNIMVNLD